MEMNGSLVDCGFSYAILFNKVTGGAVPATLAFFADLFRNGYLSPIDTTRM